MVSAECAAHAKPMIADPDSDVLAALAAGDPDGLSELMDRHLAAVKAVAWHMLGDDMAAEDVAQDTFLKAWQKAPSWDAEGGAKFKTWLVRVATNDCLSRLRKKSEILSDALPEQVDPGRGSDKVLIDDEVGAQVRAAMDELPDRQRLALTLSHFQNLSQTEGADILEISVSAYESLLARARRALRDHLLPLKDQML